ncbi:MAG: MMPL family transporter [Balneolaceae bacterium]
MLEILFRYLRPTIKNLVCYPWIVVGTGLLLALAGLILALNLRIDNDLSKLLPDHYPSVQAVEKLRQQVGSSDELAVVIESASFELNRKFAERLIPRAMQLQYSADKRLYFNRYEYRKQTEFLESNALYFATDTEMDLLETWLDEEIEQARMQANPFYFDIDGEEDIQADSLEQVLEETYRELIGYEYPVSEDSLTMAIRFYPADSQTDIQYIRQLYQDMDQLTTELLEEFESEEIRVVLAGRLFRSLVEIDSIYQDVRNSFGAGVLMLLILIMSYFFYKNYKTRSGGIHSAKVFWSEIKRVPLTALIMGLPLVVSLCWTFGVAWMFYQTLNIMTSTLGLLLFGMGVDFGIHFYARYIEERKDEASVADAIVTTFMTTGQAIMAVGITTAAAFFILMLADFRGFSEFGFIAGIGIFFSIISMIILLPAMLVLLERYGWLHTGPGLLYPGQNGKSSNTGGYEPRTGYLKTVSILVVIISIAAVVVSGWYVPNLSFEYDFGKLEPVYESYNEVAQKARKVYSDRKTRNAAYIIADTPEDAVEIRDLLRKRMETDTLTNTLLSVETLQDRYPYAKWEQQEKLGRIGGIRKKLYDSFLSSSESTQLELLRKAASTTSPIELNQVPDFILDPFTAKDGTIGNLVIVHPSVPLSDGRNSMNFADDLSEITLENGNIYHAGSTSIVASDMLRLMISEAPRMIAWTLSFIILIKLVIFRSVKWMVLALLPLAFSFTWLFGLMEFTGHTLNFYNIVVLPTILGIGDDSGIHMVHRYLEEGRGSIAKVLRSTGEHITVSALTTMLGFAGLLFSSHPGMRSIGELAVYGIGLMLLASLILLPALLYLIEETEIIIKARRVRELEEEATSAG